MEQEVKSRQAEFMKAFNSGNASAAAEFYDPNCVFMAHGRDPGNGKAAVEAYFRQDMAEGVKAVAMSSEEINGAGDWAFERGTYKLDGTRGTETGAYVLVWKKIGGKWFIHNDCFNIIKPAQQ